MYHSNRMKMFLQFVAALLLVLSTGCGGGGGGGNGGDGTADDQLLGLWKVNDAVEGTATVPLRTALGWQQTCTAMTMEFLDTCACKRTDYAGSTAVSTENGTWAAQNMSGTFTFGSDVTDFTYFVYWPDKLRADITYTRNGHTYKTRWVRPVTLTGHDPQMLRTWKAKTVKVDGVAVPLATFFELYSQNNVVTMQYLSDGSAVYRELEAERIVDREDATWATGGGTITMAKGGEQIRGICDMGGTLTTYPDPKTGAIVQIEWWMWAPDLTRDPALVGKWQAASVTQDGAPMALADFFKWEPGVTSLTTEFWPDGTVESRDYAGSTLYASDLGLWHIGGNILHLKIDSDMQMTYSISGSKVTMTMTQGGHTYVLTFNRLP